MFNKILPYIRVAIVAVLCIIVSNDHAFAQRIKSLQLKSTQNPDSLIVQLKKRYNDALSVQNREQQGLCLQQMGQICLVQGHYNLALEYFLDADKILAQLQKPNLFAANLNDLGLFYYYNKQSAQANKYYQQAFKIFEKTDDKQGLAEVLANIGHLYEKQQQYDSAFNYQFRSLHYFEQAGDDLGRAKVYENLGSIYEDLAKYDSASYYFKLSLDYYTKSDDLNGSIEVINNQGDILRKTGHYVESIAVSKRAYRMAEQHGYNYQLAATAKDLGKTYALHGQLDSAFHYAELSRKHTLDIYSVDGMKQSSLLQTLYDMEKQTNEIEQLQADRKVTQTIIVASLIVVILLVLLFVNFFSRQRLKIKEQQVEAHQRKIESELLESRLVNQKLEQEKLREQLELKSKELSTHTLHLIRNNKFLETLRGSLQAMVKDEKRDQKRLMQKLILEINESIAQEQYWKDFMQTFEQVHQTFFDRLKALGKDFTAADLRLIALLKINLNNTDIATIMGISTDSLRVSRHRLRKKLDIPQSDNLATYIQSV
ncbi:MAG: tetratricopeptide repeat protein [Sphingobacterium sp.]|jgi:tetratricopeptide (TPR) repeat protein|nr:tetratricopeptide repeat protein [Sphingobacterium sp.]